MPITDAIQNFDQLDQALEDFTHNGPSRWTMASYAIDRSGNGWMADPDSALNAWHQRNVVYGIVRRAHWQS
jgi:hypothetical protein